MDEQLQPPRPTSPLADLPAYVDHFRRRVLQDALSTATASYWHRRAAALEAARPRAGEFHGQATRTQLADDDARLAAQATACRSAAAAALLQDAPDHPGCCAPERTENP